MSRTAPKTLSTIPSDFLRRFAPRFFFTGFAAFFAFRFFAISLPWE